MLKRTSSILFLFLLLISCNDDVNYISLNDNNHLIDFKLFSIVLPKNFKYEKIDGIDSFVGKIRDDKSIFLFDYGRYSPKPPMNKENYIKESRKSMDLETTKKFFNLINLNEYQNEKGEINSREIIKKIKNLTLHKITDNIAVQNNFKGNCEFYYSFNYEEKEYKVPFCIPEEMTNKFKYYEFDVDTIQNYKRTIALWTAKENPNISSVNFEPINRDSKNELSIGIKSDMGLKKSELKKMFETVKVK